jgi:hypothetical protein
MVRASVHSVSGWKKHEQKRPALGAPRGQGLAVRVLRRYDSAKRRSMEWGAQSRVMVVPRDGAGAVAIGSGLVAMIGTSRLGDITAGISDPCR